MTTTYQAISVYQPWATLIIEGFKPWEFRGWAAPPQFVGARIAIQASARPLRGEELRGLIFKLERGGDVAKGTGLQRPDEVLKLLYRWLHLSPKTALPLQMMMGTVKLGRPVTNQVLAARLGIEHVNDSNRDEHSNWGWPLEEPRPFLPPIPARGYQGFFEWRDTRK